MSLKWSQHLSVGNAMIDSDHKNLITVVNRMMDAINAEDRVSLSKAFELFEAYMRIHTQNEEKIAEAVNYSFTQDKLSQLQLMDELKYMIEKLACMNGAWPDNVPEMYSRFLADWITDHIVKTNMPMKPALQAFPYEFIPGKSTGSYSFHAAMILPIISYIDSKPPFW